MFVRRICRPLLLIALLSQFATAQSIPTRPPAISPGDAIVSGFSGFVAVSGAASDRGRPENSFINPDAASIRVLDVGRPGHVWEGRTIPAIIKYEVLARDTGQVFGIAVGSGPDPDIYLAATLPMVSIFPYAHAMARLSAARPAALVSAGCVANLVSTFRGDQAAFTGWMVGQAWLAC